MIVRNNIKAVFIFVFLCIVSMVWANENVLAAPIKNMPITITQPDGEKIECYVSGDEYFNYIHTKDGYLIKENSITGQYSFCQVQNEQIIVSKVKITNKGALNQNSLNKSKYAKSKDLKKNNINKDIEKKIEIKNKSYQLIQPNYYPKVGTINNIVIFISFIDNPNFRNSNSYYDRIFNSLNPEIPSMKGYFNEASYNKLQINSTFYPESSSDVVLSYIDSHPRAYYEPLSYNNPIGYSTEAEGRIREHTLLKNAVDFVKNQIPSTLNLDNDNNGTVDNICFIVNGNTNGWADLLWPHRWVLDTASSYTEINDKRVWDYNLQLEDFLIHNDVGVLAHEMFHTIGAPDLYHYNYDGMTPVGIWDVMEDGANIPQYMTAYMKMKYGSWIDNIPTINMPGRYTLNPLTSQTNNAFKIKSSSNDNEYFVVEYRKRSGLYENNLPGSGLIVYRVNTLVYDGNRNGPPDEVYVFRPGGSNISDGNIYEAFLSADSGRTSIGGSTSSPLFFSDGTILGYAITNISSAGSTISFDLVKNELSSPRFNLEEATYLGEQSISISSDDSDVIIRYTTNGTEPTATSPQYTGPIRITSTTTLKAKAYKGTKSSTTRQAKYTIANILESNHPYASNVNEKWIASFDETCTEIKLTFDSFTNVEGDNDFIEILDVNDHPIEGSPFTGNALAGRIITVQGNTAKIILKSDLSYEYYGFKITDIQNNSTPKIEVNKTVIPTNVNSQVIFTVKSNNIPVANKEVSLIIDGQSISGVSNSSGIIVFNLTPKNVSNIQVQCGDKIYNDLLFALDSKNGLIEVTAKDSTGQTLSEFDTVISGNNFEYYSSSNSRENKSRERVIAPIGAYTIRTVGFMNNSFEVYHLDKNVTVLGSKVNPVSMSTVGTIKKDVKFSYNGLPIDGANIMIKPTNTSLKPIGIYGADENGSVVLNIIPKQYDLFVDSHHSKSNNENLALSKRAVSLQSTGLINLNWSPSDTGLINFNITDDRVSNLETYVLVHLNEADILVKYPNSADIVNQIRTNIGETEINGASVISNSRMYYYRKVEKVNVSSSAPIDYKLDVSYKSFNVDSNLENFYIGDSIKLYPRIMTNSGHILAFAQIPSFEYTITGPNNFIYTGVYSYVNDEGSIEISIPNDLKNVGRYKLSFQLTDDSGIYSNKTCDYEFIVGLPASKKPIINLTLPVNNLVDRDGTINLKGSIANFLTSGMTLKVYVDDATIPVEYNLLSGNFDVNLNIEEGVHQIKIQVFDKEDIVSSLPMDRKVYYIKNIDFSFDGSNAGKLMGISDQVEYSLDGRTFTHTNEKDPLLTKEELAKVNSSMDIKLRVKGFTTLLQTIDIQTPTAPITVKADDFKNIVTGIDGSMEFSRDNGVTWSPYSLAEGKDNLGTLNENSTLLVRKIATGIFTASLPARLTFTSKYPLPAIEAFLSTEYSEGSENNKFITLKAIACEFTEDISKDNVSFVNLPQGITFNLERIDETTLKVTFIGNSLVDYDSDIALSIIVNKTKLQNPVQLKDLTTSIKLPATVEKEERIPNVTFSFIGENKGKLMNSTNELEYSVDGGKTYTVIDEVDYTIPEDKISLISSVYNLKIRYKANFRIPAGKDQIIIIGRTPSAPSVTFSFNGLDANKLKGSTIDMEYSLDGGITYSDIQASNITLPQDDLSKLSAEKDIRVRVKAISNQNASLAKIIDISPEPAAPTIIKVSDDFNTITGLTSLMEYKIDKEGENGAWIKHNPLVYPNLSGDIILSVRVAATSTTLAGKIVEYPFTKNPPITVSNIDFKTTPTEGQESGASISIDIKDGTFSTAINIKDVTVSGLPTGIKLGSVIRREDNKLSVNLVGNSTEDYDVERELTISISGNVLLPKQDNIEAKISLMPVIEAIPEKPESITFSFDGLNKNKLMGTNLNMEYSLDGGITYLPVRTINQSLTFIEVQKITDNTDIFVRRKSLIINGAIRTNPSEVCVIPIESQETPELRADNLKNVITDISGNEAQLSIDMKLEFSTNNGLTWIKYNGSNLQILNTGNLNLLVRKYANNNYCPSEAVTLTFTSAITNVSLNATFKEPILEGNENGAEIRLAVENGAFINRITASKILIEGLPRGIRKGVVTRISDTEIAIKLVGNSLVDYDTDLQLTIKISGDQIGPKHFNYIRTTLPLTGTVE